MKFYSAYLQSLNGSNIRYGILADLSIDQNRKIYFAPESNYIIEVSPQGISFINYGVEWGIVPIGNEIKDISEFLPKPVIIKKVARKRKK